MIKCVYKNDYMCDYWWHVKWLLIGDYIMIIIVEYVPQTVNVLIGTDSYLLLTNMYTHA